MSFSVIAPPREGEQALADAGKEIIFKARDLGLELDVEGFLTSWVGGATKVAVERNSEGEIITLALAAIGHRWVHNEVSASILAIAGENEDTMLEFIKTLTLGAGGRAVFCVSKTPYNESENKKEYTVTEYLL